MNNEQYEESQQQQQAAYSGATATAVVVSDDQRNRSLVSNVADFYASNPYVYVPDANLMPAQALSANFFPPTAYFPTGAPAALDFLAWTPWSFEMIHGSELNSPLVDYSHQFPGASSNQLHNRLPPLQSGLAVPAEFPLTSFMTRSSGTNSNYGTRSQTSGRKGGRRPREIEDKDQYELSHEDKEKRQKRRERNKQAAARCRKRRMDLMETLQDQVDKLKEENTQKQMINDQLNHQLQEMMGLLQGHSCQVQNKILPQQLRHMQTSNKEQHLPYNGCDLMQRQQQQQHLALKMEPDNSMGELHSEIEGLYKNSQMDGDRSSSPINDPVISHASFPPSSNKRRRLDQSSMDSNESPAFSRPNTLPLITPQYCSPDLTSNLPSLNTPSAGLLGNYTGGEFGTVLNQQTFLTPMTLGPIPITSNANTPPHGDLRQL